MVMIKFRVAVYDTDGGYIGSTLVWCTCMGVNEYDPSSCTAEARAWIQCFSSGNSTHEIRDSIVPTEGQTGTYVTIRGQRLLGGGKQVVEVVLATLETRESPPPPPLPPSNMPNFGKKYVFQKSHELTYGVEISERDAATSVVLAAKCRFCAKFGREASCGMKRKRTSAISLFGPSFRTENYRRHLERAHPKKWEEYQGLDKDGKRAFFDASIASYLDAELKYPVDL
eukprot:UC4_evm3s236